MTVRSCGVEVLLASPMPWCSLWRNSCCPTPEAPDEH
jgi:hypothetical protein